MRTHLTAWTGMAFAAGVGMAVAASPPLVLRNAATVIEFAARDEGYALVALQSLASALDVVASGVSGSVLWRLTLRGPGYAAETEVGIDSTTSCRHEAECREQDGVTELRLRWLGLGLPGEPGALDVTATIRLPAGQGLSEWRIAVANRSGTRGLWGVDYPVLPNLRVSTAGQLAVPLGWGTVLDDPVRKGNYSAEYPSLFATLQCTALADQGAALYVATHDPDGYVKQLNWRAHAAEERLEYCLHHYPEDMGTPGKAYASPFPTVIGFVPGDWLDAAKLYRRWVVAQAPWVPREPLEHFTGSPRWIKENPLWLQSNGTGSAAPSDCLAQCLDLKQALGGVAIAGQPYWWQVGWPGQKQFDEGYPDTFLTLGRGDEEQQVIKRVQGGGVRLVPYTNPNLVDARTAYWKDSGWRWAALPAEQAGRQQEWIAEINEKAAKDTGPVNVTMCPYAPERQDVVVAWSQRIVGDFGFDGVYLDQVGCIHATLCFDPTHGHPLGGGRHWVDGYRRLLGRVQKAVRALNPEAILTTESAAEPFGVFDAYLRCNEAQGWVAALWPAVYDGLLTSYGSYLNPEDMLGGVPYAAKLAQLFTYGAQLGWVSAAEKTNPRPAWLDYLQELVQARLAAVRWVGMGEYLRPPRLCEAEQVTGRWKLFAAEYDVTWPALLTAAFRAADGSVALVFTNYTGQPRQATWEARVADLGLTAGRYELAALYPVGGVAVAASEGPWLRGTLTLPALSVQVWRVLERVALPDPVIARADVVYEAGPALCPYVVLAGNGDLVACWNTRGDGMPGAETQFARSADRGRTWAPPYMTLRSATELTGSVSSLHLAPGRDADAARLLCYTLELGWPAEPDQTKPDFESLAAGRTFDSYYALSADHGYTFTARTLLSDPVQRNDFAQGNIVTLPDGDLLWPWGTWDPEALNGFRRSTDGGLSWGPVVRAWQDPPPGQERPLAFNETAAAVCRDGSMVAVARVDTLLDKRFWQIRSADRGRTWTAPRQIEIAGGSPALYCTPGGQLWLAYRDAGLGPGLGLAVSDDQGETWRFLYHLRDPKGSHERRFGQTRYTDADRLQPWRPAEGVVGYPCFAKLSDHDVYVAFHLHAWDREGVPLYIAGNLLTIGE